MLLVMLIAQASESITLERFKGEAERKWKGKRKNEEKPFHFRRFFLFFDGAIIDLKARCFARFFRAPTRPPRSRTTS